VRGFHLVARIRQSGLLVVVVMFHVDATMRPLLMTFESRRVTLNGGDANFKVTVFVADDRPNAHRADKQ
jgi:hypothetical protein